MVTDSTQWELHKNSKSTKKSAVISNIIVHSQIFWQIIERHPKTALREKKILIDSAYGLNVTEPV